MSFMMLIEELHYLGEIDLHVTLLTRARDCEFLVVLQRVDAASGPADRFLARKMSACKVLMLEEMERIQSIKAEETVPDPPTKQRDRKIGFEI